MYLPENIGAIIRRLARTEKTDHFVIHYELRNPTPGRGLGPHGIRDRSLIDTYARSLESLYNTMTSAPWNRDPPKVGEDGKTHVYIFNSGYPFTTYDLNKVPYIVLPSRNNEPTIAGELNRAASEAVHEATHVFNYTQRPLHDKFSATRWEWFDEGLAVLMEMRVAKGNPDYRRFLLDWIDSPEMSVDHPDGKYQAGMFIRFVADRLGDAFVNEVWMNSNPDEEPLDALERLAPEGQKFFSADLDVCDIFVHGYSLVPYFLWEHDAEIFDRFGERAVSESFLLPDADGTEIKDHLDHLSCRYYRFFLTNGTVDFTVDVNVGDSSTHLKAVAAVIANDKTRQMLEPVRPGKNGTISFVLKSSEETEIDHVVLVVSNCGTNRPLNGNLVDHDGCEFRVVVRANGHSHAGVS